MHAFCWLERLYHQDVLSLPLHGVCTVEPESSDTDETFGGFWLWFGNIRVDEERGGWALAVLDIYGFHCLRHGQSGEDGCGNTERIEAERNSIQKVF